MHNIKRLKKKKIMNAEKAFDKIQHSFLISKKVSGNSGDFSQPDKGHL